jgi:V/A-type H+/Na+-transporting ATPase subunit F
MSNIAVISSGFSLQPMAALGVRVEVSGNQEKCGQILDQLVKENYSLIFITEDLAEANMDKIDIINRKGSAYVSLLPDAAGKSSLASNRIAKKAKNAIGTNVVGRN